MSDDWKEQKKRQKAIFTAQQNLPYDVKVRRAEFRAREFIQELDRRGMNAHVSVGGLDSIVLLMFLRSRGIDVPAISVSSLEDKSIIKVHKQLGVISLRPGKPKTEILQEFGFPVISKKIAGRIDTLQNPTDRNKTVRHAIITGECGAQGHFAKNSRMKLPRKWLQLFAGYENENEGVNYQIAPFKVSNKCCLYMKEKPCEVYAKENNSAPFLGQDLLQLALDLDVPVPEIYGEIARKADGTLYTTKAQRTGCSMCGFGVHLEKRPHRFDMLRDRNEKEWEFWMYRCCVDQETGERFGWGRVLDYIGVRWEDKWEPEPEQLEFHFC